SVSSNRRVWTFSMFVRRADQLPHGAWVVEPWFSAGGAELGSDYTGMYWNFDRSINNPIGQWNLYWNNSDNAIAGLDNSGAPIGFTILTPIHDTLWHHFLLGADGTTEYIKLDGVLVAQGPIHGDGAVNAAGRTQMIGSDADDLGQQYGSNIMIAEVNFIDGLALDWTSFAQAIGSVFIPKPYTGIFGTNGFYLNFSDGSAATSTTMGKDWSGNGNNFTPVNLTTGAITSNFPG